MSHFKGDRSNSKIYCFTGDWDWDAPMDPNTSQAFQPQVSKDQFHKSGCGSYHPLSLKDTVRRYLYWDLKYHHQLGCSLSLNNYNLYRVLASLMGLSQKYFVSEVSRAWFLKFARGFLQHQEKLRSLLGEDALKLSDLQSVLFEVPTSLYFIRRDELPFET